MCQKQKTTRNCAWILNRLKRGNDNELEKNLRPEKESLANSLGWQWRQKKKEAAKTNMASVVRIQVFSFMHS